MKLLIALTTILILANCAPLAGTRIDFDSAGNALITPPPHPLIIPSHK